MLLVDKGKLKREGQKWVDDEIITKAQLEQILDRYQKRDPNFLLVLFAVLLTGLGFLTFIFSDWAQVPHFSRVLIVLVVTIGLYVLGDFLHRTRSILLGISFISLGYIVFGAGMFLILNIYQVQVWSVWPFIIWSIIGLILYFIYEHKLLYALGLTVITVGQIYSGMNFSDFNWILFLVFLIGFAHFTYHHANKLFGYLFALSFVLQMLMLILAYSKDYYWLIIYILILYIVSQYISKQPLKEAFYYTSLLSIFILGMAQAFMLQDDFYLERLQFETIFFIVWGILFVLSLLSKIMQKRQLEIIDLILFLPIYYLPFPSMFALIILFVFSICWLIIGYQQDNNSQIQTGTIAFLLSTFTVYIQYAWDTMNKSLFFFIGGILLFLISFIFQRQRKKLLESGGTKK